MIWEVEVWLTAPAEPEPHLQTVLFAKVVLALMLGRPAERYLDAQRAAHLRRMHELTALKRAGSLTDTLPADYGLFHLEKPTCTGSTRRRPGSASWRLCSPGERPPDPRKVTLPLLKRITGPDNARFE